MSVLYPKHPFCIIRQRITARSAMAGSKDRPYFVAGETPASLARSMDALMKPDART